MTEPTCKVCDNNHANSKHHIIPKVFTDSRKVMVCKGCHNKINLYFSSYELFKLAKENIYPTTEEFKKLLDERIKEMAGKE